MPAFTRRQTLALGAAAGLAASLPAMPARAAKVGWNPGDIFPDMAFRMPDGSPRKVSDYSGKALFLYFAGSWCPYCQSQMPAVVEIWQRLKDDPRIDWAMIAYREAPEITRKWINQDLGAAIPVVDPDNARTRVITLLNGNTTQFVTPTGYVLAPGSIIHYWRQGSGRTEQYETALNEAAAKVGPKA